MPPYDGDDEHYVEGAHGTLAEQKDEAYYDDRSDASDDLEKGRLKFPDRIYGRDRELEALHCIYEKIASSKKSESTEAGDQSELSPEPYDGSRVVFLSGYSGVGKSGLVNEFVRQTRLRFDSPILYACGKYTEQSTASAPFSALAEVFEKLAHDLMAGNDLCSIIRSRIKESDLIGPGTEGSRVLRATFPALAVLLDDKAQRGRSSAGGVHPSMNAIKESTCAILSAVCEALEHPLIIFLDDNQWGDEASFDVLSFLLSSATLCNVMFICAYRSNEVDADHSFQKVMEGVTASRDDDGSKCENTLQKTVVRMDLFSLSPTTIKEFIADSVKREDAEGIDELVEAVYQKTMGNIFFTKQALEELVRKNVLFYDVMCFEWRWVVSKVDELASYMSDDVVETVKGKIKELSIDMQHVLVVMAYIPNALDVSILRALINHGELSFDNSDVRELLREASEEGMLMHSSDSECYFAHDRIRQASLAFATEKDQDDLLLHISQVLRDFASRGQEMEWCLYVAVDLLNSLEPEKTSCIELIKLNVKVAKIARSRGALGKESNLLHQGLQRLESSGLAWKEYELTLDLYNAVIVSEYCLGSYSNSLVSIEKVLDKAKSLDDKLWAHFYQMMCEIEETSDYSKGLTDGVKILNLYGFCIPTAITKSHLMKEEAKLKVALRNRSYSSLSKLPVVDEPMFEVLAHVQKCALYTSQANMLKIISWKSMQYAIKHGMGRYLPMILAILAMSLANEGKVKTAQELGNLSISLCEKIPDDTEICASTRFLTYANVLPKLQPFRCSVEPLLESHKDLKLVGVNVECTLAAMQGFFESIFASGLELGPLLESKLVLVEELCSSLGRPGWLVNFQILRQFALNLRTRKEKPSEFKGDAFHEEEALSKMTPNARKMALRDSSSSRLQLGFIFRDDDVMSEMLERLIDYPLKDAAAGRLHNRLCFAGLAAFALCQEKENESFSKLGKDCLNYFSHLVKHGSVDGKPVYLFMLALKAPRREAFRKAIDACNEAKMAHLQAMACERYAMLLEKENDAALAHGYINSSYWLYQDWGADAKAFQLASQYDFLRDSKRNDANKRSTFNTAATLQSSSTTSRGRLVSLYSYNTTFRSSQRISVKK